MASSSRAIAGPIRGAIELIDLSELGDVRGGADSRTSQLQLVIAQLVSQMKDLGRKLAPKGPNVFELLSQFQPVMRRGSGPNSAPALPPPSTLSR
jgi:hypothetical protein